VSVAGNQAQTFLRLLQPLRGRWRSDLALPRFIQSLISQERSFGSRDRRLYRELIYTSLRYLPWVEPWIDREPARAVKIVAWLAAETKDTRAFRAELAADWPLANSLAERAAFLEAYPHELLPAWFREHCPEIFDPVELETQLSRAPLWLRLQTDEPKKVADEFAEKGWRFRPSTTLPSAWQMLDDVDVTESSAYQQGLIEVQDLGSQLLLESIGLEAGSRWFDACAGAGGKSLQLARLLGSHGHVNAYDVRRAALDELDLRVARAGARNVHTNAPPTPVTYEGVLVDAPCSGSGTWRRAPHLKWVTRPQLVADRARLQQELLSRFAVCVRPGGRLVYATCSLSSHENEQVVAAFLAGHADFEVAPFARTFGGTPRGSGLLIFPSVHDTDGFFVSSLKRR
jgi:16S rRNA (cytosine967-C5)-methyltransferase